MRIRPTLASTATCVFALCLSSSYSAQAAQHSSPKTSKPVLRSIAAGATGPIPQIPLDSIPALPPKVSYQNKMLTIVAPNSTLGDILAAVREKTGTEVAIPVSTDRVVTRLGPGSAADVLSELLTGSRFNFVLVSSPTDPGVLKRIVLLPKTTSAEVAKPSLAAKTGSASQAEVAHQPVQDQEEEPQGMLETPDEF